MLLNYYNKGGKPILSVYPFFYYGQEGGDGNSIGRKI
jgi:hypothetical protein